MTLDYFDMSGTFTFPDLNNFNFSAKGTYRAARGDTPGSLLVQVVFGAVRLGGVVCRSTVHCIQLRPKYLLPAKLWPMTYKAMACKVMACINMAQESAIKDPLGITGLVITPKNLTLVMTKYAYVCA